MCLSKKTYAKIQYIVVTSQKLYIQIRKNIKHTLLNVKFILLYSLT